MAKKFSTILAITILILAVMAPSAFAGWTGGHVVMGGGYQKISYFAEGCVRPGFDTYFCLLNMQSETADTTIYYMPSDGEVVAQNLQLEPRIRYTVNAKDVLGEGDDTAHDFATRVVSNRDITVERPMYFSYKGVWTGGSDVAGIDELHETLYFAEGTCRPNFESYFCLFNPNGENAEVKITYMLGDATNREQNVTVSGYSRYTVYVNEFLGTADDTAHDFSAKIECTNGQGIVAERPMYFAYCGGWDGGHDVMASSTPNDTYYFAEGTCRPNFETFFCVQNPNDTEVTIDTTFMLGNGENQTVTNSIPKYSRFTLRAVDILGVGNDTAHDFSTKMVCKDGKEILAERPMYFNYNGWTGGHNVVGTTNVVNRYMFAEGTCRPGFDTYYCIQNPNDYSTQVKLNYILGDGTQKESTIDLLPNSRGTVRVNDILGVGNDTAHDFSVLIGTANSNEADIIVERPMYFDYTPHPYTPPVDPVVPVDLTVDVIDSRGCKDPTGKGKYFAIVQNNTGVNVDNVKVTAGCYDSSGNLLSTASSYSDVEVLDPEDTSSVIVTFDPTPVNASTFELINIEWSTCDRNRNKDVTATNVNATLPLPPIQYYTGTLEGTEGHEDIGVTMAFVDSSGDLICIDSAVVDEVGFTYAYNIQYWGQANGYMYWINCQD